MELLVGSEVRSVHQGHQGVPVCVENQGDEGGTVPAAVGVAGSGDGHLRSETGHVGPHRAEGQVAVRLIQGGIEQGDVDVLPLTGGVAVAQGGQHGEGAMKASQVVGQKGRCLEGSSR